MSSPALPHTPAPMQHQQMQPQQQMQPVVQQQPPQAPIAQQHIVYYQQAQAGAPQENVVSHQAGAAPMIVYQLPPGVQHVQQQQVMQPQQQFAQGRLVTNQKRVSSLIGCFLSCESFLLLCHRWSCTDAAAADHDATATAATCAVDASGGTTATTTATTAATGRCCSVYAGATRGCRSGKDGRAGTAATD